MEIGKQEKVRRGRGKAMVSIGKGEDTPGWLGRPDKHKTLEAQYMLHDISLGWGWRVHEPLSLVPY